jgi:N-acetylmuramoyl-L-alanine amidase
MPRVLIEMGFISNQAEGAKLDSEEGQQEIAESIANAIISYKKEYFGASDNDNTIKPSQKIDTVKIDDSVTKKETVKANEEKKSEPKPEVKPESKPEVISSVVPSFKVQLLVSGKKLELVPSNFNGLSNISITSEGDLYKYMYGETTNYDEAKRLLSEVKSKGYTSAFLIAFKNGKKVGMWKMLVKGKLIDVNMNYQNIRFKKPEMPNQADVKVEVKDV